MKCSHCQRRLLQADNPTQPVEGVAAHLRACSACRAFQRQLLQIENNVPRVPVPAPGGGKDRLLRMLLADAPPQAEARPQNHQRPLPRPATPPRQRLAGWWAHREIRMTAAVAAAAAVLIACGIWLGNWLARSVPDNGPAPLPQAELQTGKTPAPLGPGPKQVADPFKNQGKKPAVVVKGPSLMARLVQYDLKLASTDSQRERVEVLAEMAGALQEESHNVAKSATATALLKQAQRYRKTVSEGIVPEARKLPMEERPEVLKHVSAQLAQTAQAADKMAKQLPPGSAQAFREIAAAARAGDEQIRGLMEATE